MSNEIGIRYHKIRIVLFGILAIAAFAVWAPETKAESNFFSANCSGCHIGQTGNNYCGMCHAHGVHSTTSKSNINVSGVPNKTSYAPGETVNVTISGGYRPSAARAVLFDQNGVELARSTGTVPSGGFAPVNAPQWPVTLSAPAPTSPGTYSWKVAWYGNQFDAGGAFFGPVNNTNGTGWKPDPNRSGHGWEIVLANSFTVSAPTQAGALSVSPAGGLTSSGTVGGPFTPSSQSYTLQNTGGQPVSWTAGKTQSWVTLSSTGGSLAAGASATVTVSIGSGANSLAANSYSDTVTFTNTTNGTGNTTRPVSLTVTADTPPPTGAITLMPGDGAKDVPITTVVTVTGDGSVGISTIVNENTFSLMEGSPVAMTTNLSESDDDHSQCVSEGIVNGEITFTSNTVATFTPLCPLKGSTTYTATITPPAGVQQSVLAEPMVWSFATIAMTPDSDDDGDPDAGDESPKDCRNATPGTPKRKGKITMNLDGHPNGCFKNITATSETVPSVNRTGMPSGYEFRDGVITYEIQGIPPGETDTVTLTYPEAFPAGSKVYKVDASGFHEFTDAVIDGNTVTLRVADGGKGDMDGTADGKILDPVGVAVPTGTGGGSIDMSTDAAGGGCSVVGAGGGWKEAAGSYGLIALAWFGLALRRRRPKSGK